MWIVAGNASKTSIALLPTSAALKPVRRETNGSDVSVLSDHIPPCAVTCPAKIDRLTRGEMRWVEYQSGCFAPRLSKRHVTGSRSVAAFARDALHELGGIKMAVAPRGCCVTSETQDLVSLRNGTSGSKIRHYFGLAWCDGKTEASNKADPTLIHVPVLPIYVSLTTPARRQKPKPAELRSCGCH